jgi:tRNA (cytidine32/uridine32-2'-O)-methyltransferase
MLEPRECGQQVFAEAKKYPVALVFGRESSGLTNEELQQCNFHVHIPANPEYSALNLAMAVQVISYEVRMAMLAEQKAPFVKDEQAEYPLTNEMEGFYQHLEQTLKDTGFIVPQHPGQVLTKLRRLFNRARPEAQELKMLRGVLSSAQKAARK